MHQNAVSSLFAMCVALYRHRHALAASPLVPPVSSAAGSAAESLQATAAVSICDPLCQSFADGGDYYWEAAAACVGLSCGTTPAHNHMLCCMAAASEDVICQPASQRRDIWLDAALLSLVKTGSMDKSLSAAESYRLQQRAKPYQFRTFDRDGVSSSVLYRVMSDGSSRVVPPPSDRRPIIQAMHEKCGHFGEKRTVHLVLSCRA